MGAGIRSATLNARSTFVDDGALLRSILDRALLLIGERVAAYPAGAGAAAHITECRAAASGAPVDVLTPIAHACLDDCVAALAGGSNADPAAASAEALGAAHDALTQLATCRPSIDTALDEMLSSLRAAETPADLARAAVTIAARLHALVAERQTERRTRLDTAVAAAHAVASELAPPPSVMVDALTGLVNRGGFDRTLAGLDRLRQRRCAIAAICVSNLPEINDEHGYATGDRVLRAVAVALRGNTHQRDLCARFSGAHFAVLFPDVSRRQAEARIDGARSNIDSARLTAEDGRAVAITLTTCVAAAVAAEPLSDALARVLLTTRSFPLHPVFTASAALEIA